MPDESRDKPILCPSAQPDVTGAKVFGVMTGTGQDGLRVGYLGEAQAVSPDVLAAAAPAAPTEVMRIAARCMGHGCGHFDGANCRLATRIATMLDPVVRTLPRCAIRPTCRWFRQEGPAACFRCPQVVTDVRDANELQRTVAGGDEAQVPERALFRTIDPPSAE
jgi:hypothetical protein